MFIQKKVADMRVRSGISELPKKVFTGMTLTFKNQSEPPPDYNAKFDNVIYDILKKKGELN